MHASFNRYITERSFALTLRYHKKLNPKLWKRSVLDRDVRVRLLRGAVEFAEYSGVPQDRIHDVVLTGGNCNYNYTKYSDLDVHIVADVSALNTDELYRKKVTWSLAHNHTTVAGYPVEFYVEDKAQARAKGQGSYSLMHDRWVSVPVKLDSVDVLTDPKVLQKVRDNIRFIRRWLLRHGTAEQIQDFKEKMWRGRTAGLQDGGEFSVENVVYKDLRNRGLIEALNIRLRELESR